MHFKCDQRNARYTPSLRRTLLGLVLLLGLNILSVSTRAEVIEVKYPDFTIWLDCEKRGAVKFMYKTVLDTGNSNRSINFYLDRNIPSRCQQTSTLAYRTNGLKYHRGHLIGANHLDFDDLSIKESNYMINVLPMASTMNTGAYLHTEKIIECLREPPFEPLIVLGGVIWGNDRRDDYFEKSHGITTPDAFWKVVISKHDVIAWLIPNKHNATAKNIDKYLVSINEIEKKTGESFGLPSDISSHIPLKSWVVRYPCDMS